MRILILIPSLNPLHGGPPEAVRALARALVELGHAPAVATMDAPDAAWLRAAPCPVHALGPAYTGYQWAPGFRPWLHRHATQFDAVIVNSLWQYQSFAAWTVLRDGRTPYLAFTHGMLDPWFKREYPLKHAKKWLYWPWADYRLLRDAAAVCFTTETERRLARESFGLYRAREVVVGFGTARPPQDVERQRTAFARRFPALADGRYLLFLGRVHPKKGCDLLLEAFFAHAERARDLRLAFAGPEVPGHGAALRSRAAALGIADRVDWLGMLAGDEKWGALRGAAAFVLPSHSENFGVAVVEALACGVPVLLSDRVNIADEVAAAGAGLVGSDDVAGTSALLARWLALDEQALAGMRAAAGRLFAERYDVVALARRLVALAASARAKPLLAAGEAGLESRP